MAPSKGKGSQGPPQGSSRPTSLHVKVNSFCKELEKHSKRNGPIKFNTVILNDLVEALRKRKYKSQLVDTLSIAKVLEFLDIEKGIDLCTRLEPPVFSVIAKTALQGERCRDMERIVYLLAASLHRQSRIPEKATGALSMRKEDIGKFLMLDLIDYLVYEDKNVAMRRVVGILCLQLHRGCEKNAERIDAAPEDTRRSLGQLLIEATDEIFRLICGQLVCDLHQDGIPLNALFPVSYEESTYADFPAPTQGTGSWFSTFSAFIDGFSNKTNIDIESGGQFHFVGGVTLMPDHQFGDIAHNCCLFVEEERGAVTLFAAARDELPDSFLEFPLDAVMKLSIFEPESQFEHTKVVKMHIRPAAATAQVFLDAKTAPLELVTMQLNPGEVEVLREICSSRDCEIEEGPETKESQELPGHKASQVFHTSSYQMVVHTKSGNSQDVPADTPDEDISKPKRKETQKAVDENLSPTPAQPQEDSSTEEDEPVTAEKVVPKLVTPRLTENQSSSPLKGPRQAKIPQPGVVPKVAQRSRGDVRPKAKQALVVGRRSLDSQMPQSGPSSVPKSSQSNVATKPNSTKTQTLTATKKALTARPKKSSPEEEMYDIPMDDDSELPKKSGSKKASAANLKAKISNKPEVTEKAGKRKSAPAILESQVSQPRVSRRAAAAKANDKMRGQDDDVDEDIEIEEVVKKSSKKTMEPAATSKKTQGDMAPPQSPKAKLNSEKTVDQDRQLEKEDAVSLGLIQDIVDDGPVDDFMDMAMDVEPYSREEAVRTTFSQKREVLKQKPSPEKQTVNEDESRAVATETEVTVIEKTSITVLNPERPRSRKSNLEFAAGLNGFLDDLDAVPEIAVPFSSAGRKQRSARVIVSEIREVSGSPKKFLRETTNKLSVTKSSPARVANASLMTDPIQDLDIGDPEEKKISKLLLPISKLDSTTRPVVSIASKNKVEEIGEIAAVPEPSLLEAQLGSSVRKSKSNQRKSDTTPAIEPEIIADTMAERVTMSSGSSKRKSDEYDKPQSKRRREDNKMKELPSYTPRKTENEDVVQSDQVKAKGNLELYRHQNAKEMARTAGGEPSQSVQPAATPTPATTKKMGTLSQKPRRTQKQTIDSSLRRSPRLVESASRQLQAIPGTGDLVDETLSRKPQVISFGPQGPRNQGASSVLRNSARRSTGDNEVNNIPSPGDKKRKRVVDPVGHASPPSKRQHSSPNHVVQIEEDEIEDDDEAPLVNSSPPIRRKPAHSPARQSPRPVAFRNISYRQSSQSFKVNVDGSPKAPVNQQDHIKPLEERLASNPETKTKKTKNDTSSRRERGLSVTFGPSVQLTSKAKAKPTPPEVVTSRYVAHEKTADGQYMDISTTNMLEEAVELPDPFTGQPPKENHFTEHIRKHNGGTPAPTSKNARNIVRQTKAEERKVPNVRSPAHDRGDSSGPSSSSSEAPSDRKPLREKANAGNQWNTSVRAHLSSANEAIHRIADDLIVRLSENEDKMDLLADHYKRDGTAIVEMLTNKRAGQRETVSGNLDGKKESIVKAYMKARDFMKDTKSDMKENSTEAFEAHWKKQQLASRNAIAEGRKVME